ncbi:hypothetical protein [Rubritalea squalenifaciens]|nr:hypothetical protein [Rubritalea squalenifaciens]
MKTRNSQTCYRTDRVCRRGFALVSTITVMVLLVTIGLGVVALSTRESKISSLSSAEVTARSNARMALMMALGRLQEWAGPDQRVTARADIREDAHADKKYWTGFWDTRQWGPDPNNSNHKKILLGYGASGAPVGDTGDSISDELTGDLVTLVGEGSVLNPQQQVSVNEIPILNNNQVEGSYGWWIGDEGVKASYYAPELGDDSWNKAGVLGTAAKTGVTALSIDGYEQTESKDLEKSSLTRSSIALPFSEPDLPKQYYHDLTTTSVSLLTDVRTGGVQSDLSTAFELPREEFNSIAEFHAAGEQNNTNFYDELGTVYNDPRFYHSSSSPELGYVCEIPYDKGFVRGASWDLLRNHYRFYKRELERDPWSRAMSGVDDENFAARGSYPHSYSGNKGGANDKGGDDFGYHISEGHLYSKASFGTYGNYRPLSKPRGGIASANQNGLTIARSPKLTPVVVRLSIAIGMVKRPLANSQDWSLALSFDPYLTVMNPYNVPISFESIGIWCTKFNPLQVEIEYTDQGGARRRVNADKYFSGNYYSFGTFNMIMDPAAGPFTLKPGETRVLSPEKLDTGKQVSYSYISTMRGGFSYSEDSGFYMANNTSVRPKTGTSVKVKLKGRRSNWGATDRYVVYLYHPKGHNGSARNLFTHVPPRNMFGDEDILDQPIIANIGASANDGKTQPNFLVERAVGTSQIPQPGDSGLYLGVLDLKMKTTKEDFPSLTVNPRGGAYDTRDWDGGDRTNPQWAYDLTAVDDLSQLQLVAGPDGQSFWGEGRTVADGSESTVLYEVPELPMTSLAQFQHVNTGVTGSSGSLQIGNSFPHPGLADLASISGERSTVSGSYSSVRSQVLSDMAWASNDRLWDRYFLSGINWGAARAARLDAKQEYVSHDAAIQALLEGDRSRSWPLQNPRMDLFSRDLTKEQQNELKEYDKIAKYLAIFGGFNVNSTSVSAWKALFSSMRDAEVTYVKNGAKVSRKVQGGFSRFTVPSSDPGEVFGALRELSENEIEALAEAMVKQVKLRGPFMGLGEFVNRSITDENRDGTDLGAVGALQAAIESVGLNDSLTQKPVTQNIENVSYSVDGKTRDISNYAGASGYLTQADVLSAVGGVLRARSDTFVIRAYGSAKDKNGKVLAEAWCEAVVQRTPEWCEPTDEKAYQQRSSYPQQITDEDKENFVMQQFEANDKLSPINEKLGRKFKIKSFKWLNSDEV